MERRVILAFVLSMLIIFLWGLIRGGVNRAPKRVAKQKSLRIGRKKEEKIEINRSVAPGKIKDIRVETPLYECILTNYEGRIKRWVLKRYYDRIGRGAKRIELVYPGRYEKLPLSFGIMEGNFGFAEGEIFDVNRDNLVLKGNEVKDIEFSMKGKGVEVSKRYIFYANSYRVDLEIDIKNRMDRILTGRPKLEWILFKKENIPPFSEGILFVNNRVIRDKLGKIGAKKVYRGKIMWLGFEDKYFISAIVPRAFDQAEARFLKIKDSYVGELILPVQYIKRSGTYKYSLYLGPKEFNRLEALKVKLDKSINLGWFGVIAKPILFVLKFFYSFTGNYGVAIILLAILIKILFHPLNVKSFKSMREMQRLQPIINSIRERYKDDKERMNKEIMELYRRYKVNPLGGCLPLLIQFPVFLALYNALLNSIELRHTPFILWIKDLSAKDPYYITPVIMGITMLIQQKLTPHAGDPTQEKLMYIMPLIFTVMFLNFPSGLVLYWLVNNILSIGQQYFINKKWRV